MTGTTITIIGAGMVIGGGITTTITGCITT